VKFWFHHPSRARNDRYATTIRRDGETLSSLCARVATISSCRKLDERTISFHIVHNQKNDPPIDIRHRE